VLKQERGGATVVLVGRRVPGAGTSWCWSCSLEGISPRAAIQEYQKHPQAAQLCFEALLAAV